MNFSGKIVSLFLLTCLCSAGVNSSAALTMADIAFSCENSGLCVMIDELALHRCQVPNYPIRELRNRGAIRQKIIDSNKLKNILPVMDKVVNPSDDSSTDAVDNKINKVHPHHNIEPLEIDKVISPMSNNDDSLNVKLSESEIMKRDGYDTLTYEDEFGYTTKYPDVSLKSSYDSSQDEGKKSNVDSAIEDSSDFDKSYQRRSSTLSNNHYENEDYLYETYFGFNDNLFNKNLLSSDNKEHEDEKLKKIDNTLSELLKELNKVNDEDYVEPENSYDALSELNFITYDSEKDSWKYRGFEFNKDCTPRWRRDTKHYPDLSDCTRYLEVRGDYMHIHTCPKVIPEDLKDVCFEKVSGHCPSVVRCTGKLFNYYNN